MTDLDEERPYAISSSSRIEADGKLLNQYGQGEDDDGGLDFEALFFSLS